MATYHVIIINGDRIINGSNEEIGRALRTVVRTSGQCSLHRREASYHGIDYLDSGMEFRRALENATRKYL